MAPSARPIGRLQRRAHTESASLAHCALHLRPPAAHQPPTADWPLPHWPAPKLPPARPGQLPNSIRWPTRAQLPLLTRACSRAARELCNESHLVLLVLAAGRLARSAESWGRRGVWPLDAVILPVPAGTLTAAKEAASRRCVARGRRWPLVIAQRPPLRASTNIGRAHSCAHP